MNDATIKECSKWLCDRGFEVREFWPVKELPPPKKIQFASRNLGEKISVIFSFLPYLDKFSVVTIQTGPSGFLMAEGIGASPHIAIKALLKNIGKAPGVVEALQF
jgi:hypothetical protein